MAFKYLLLGIALALVSPFAQAQSDGGSSQTFFDGGNSSGGGGPDTVFNGALKLLIEDGGLKRAMKHYLETIQVGQIEDAQARLSLSRMLKSNLLSDINNSTYFMAKAGRSCTDAFNLKVPASTEVGRLGASICFDGPKLVEAYRGLNQEEVMIRLASLAFHEHAHHFQNQNRDLQTVASNEAEADRVGGYILVTAKFVKIPVLAWSPNNLGEQFDEIKRLFETIRAKEAVFLSVRDSDYADYPDYRNQTDRGVMKLLPRETYDGKLATSGGGAYFSFSTLSHEYQSIAQIQLEWKTLQTGFGGCNFGMFVSLGDLPLDRVSLANPEISFLNRFQPASRNEPAVRKQKSSAHGLTSDGYSYSDRIRNPQVGQTFAMRSISYEEADILVAFRIVSIGKDGSMVMAWKKLRSYPVLSCG